MPLIESLIRYTDRELILKMRVPKLPEQPENPLSSHATLAGVMIRLFVRSLTMGVLTRTAAFDIFTFHNRIVHKQMEKLNESHRS